MKDNKKILVDLMLGVLILKKESGFYIVMAIRRIFGPDSDS